MHRRRGRSFAIPWIHQIEEIVDILQYREYEGTAEVDMDRCVCRGKILFIDDVVTYEAKSPADLQTEFKAAVNDYIDTCRSLGREPQKPFKGLFNVRVSPTLHRAIALRALTDGVSQNDVVVRALDAFVNPTLDVNHNVQVTLNVPNESLKTLVSSASTPPQWNVALAQRMPAHASH